MITPLIFAQANLDNVPASVFKWVLIILIGLAVAAAFIWAAVRRTDNQRSVRIEQEPTPEFRKAPKRYNYDLAEERYTDHKKRIEKLEDRVAAIELSRAKSLSGIERRFNRIWIVLTKIATKMEIDTPADTEEEVES